MECIQEEAYECIENAQKPLDASNLKNIDNVKKLLDKAKRLRLTQETEDLMVLCDSWANDEHVKRILRCKNHYEIFKVRRDADENEIRMSYNKLILLVHPDKNRAYIDRYPARKDDFGLAFRKVKDAKATLTDSLKRNMYEPEFDWSNAGVDAHVLTESDDDSGDDDSDADSNDDNLPNHVNPFDDRDANPPDHNEAPPIHREWWNFRVGFLSFMMILLIGISVLHVSNTMNPSPIYRIENESSYVIRRRTVAEKKPYYVTSNFKEDVLYYCQDSIKYLEIDVRNSYKQKNLTVECNRERKQRGSLLNTADYFGIKKLKEKVTLDGTPSCDELKELNNLFNCRKTWVSVIIVNIAKLLLFW